MEARPPSLPPAYKDRSTLVVIAGVLVTLLGLLCAGFVPLMLGAALMAPPGGQTGMGVRQVLPGALIYAALAAAFLILGVGVIRKRKWARDLLLAFSWIWLVVGVVAFLVFLFLMGTMGRTMTTLPDGKSLPDAVFWIVMGISAGMILLMYVIVPAVLVVFFGNRNVAATIRAHHPDPGWADSLSTPVLAMFLLLVSGGISLAGNFAYTPVFPLFGVFLIGWPAGILIVLLSALWLVLAWGTARLRPWAWWGTLAGMGVFWLSALVTFSTRSLMELYQAMDFPADQLAQIEKMGSFDGPWLPAAMVLGGLVFLGLMLLVKKDFADKGNDTPV